MIREVIEIHLFNSENGLMLSYTWETDKNVKSKPNLKLKQRLQGANQLERFASIRAEK